MVKVSEAFAKAQEKQVNDILNSIEKQLDELEPFIDTDSEKADKYAMLIKKQLGIFACILDVTINDLNGIK